MILDKSHSGLVDLMMPSQNTQNRVAKENSASLDNSSAQSRAQTQKQQGFGDVYGQMSQQVSTQESIRQTDQAQENSPASSTNALFTKPESSNRVSFADLKAALESLTQDYQIGGTDGLSKVDKEALEKLKLDDLDVENLLHALQHIDNQTLEYFSSAQEQGRLPQAFTQFLQTTGIFTPQQMATMEEWVGNVSDYLKSSNTKIDAINLIKSASEASNNLLAQTLNSQGRSNNATNVLMNSLGKTSSELVLQQTSEQLPHTSLLNTSSTQLGQTTDLHKPLMFKTVIANAANMQASELSQKLHSIVADKLSVQISAKTPTATIRLDPPNLGRIDMAVRFDNDKLQIQIAATSQSTRESIQMTADRLRTELVNQNFLNVEVSVTADDSSWHHDFDEGLNDQQIAQNLSSNSAQGNEQQSSEQSVEDLNNNELARA
ncbi:MAG: flagellar hook-length control protein FliK [Vibrio sp.]